MSNSSIRTCDDYDFETIWTIVNQGAQAYQGHVPADCLRDPYMSCEELRHEISSGVQFWGYEESGHLLGVMGTQDIRDVTLIRHAYVLSEHHKQGIGGKLLAHLRASTIRPVLVGTWEAALWAIRFYERHGFQMVDRQEKERLLRIYWNVPERQIETSVVLVDERWRESRSQGTKR